MNIRKIFRKFFPRRFTDEQILALKYLIFKSDHGSRLLKQILVFLIDHSERFTKPVVVTLTEGDEWTSDEIHANVDTIRGMLSSMGATHLNEIFRCMGTDFHFHSHYGDFNQDGEFDTSGQFVWWPDKSAVRDPRHLIESPMRYTFWLQPDYYGSDVEILTVTRAELESINVVNSGLYKNLNDSRFRGQEIPLNA